MQYRPTANRIFVRQDKAPEKSEGGIILPNAEPPLFGEVIALGPKAEGLSLGQRVMFSQYAGTGYDIDGERILLMADDGVIAAVEPLNANTAPNPAP